MYVFRARYVCLGPWTELNGSLEDMALVVEQAVGLALCDRIGVVLLECIHIAAHPGGSGQAFTLRLELRSPDEGTRIRRATQGRAQHLIELIVLRLLRELFGPVTVEAAELSYEACDAAWDDVMPWRGFLSPVHDQSSETTG